jgi:hypothetical protein
LGRAALWRASAAFRTRDGRSSFVTGTTGAAVSEHAAAKAIPAASNRLMSSTRRP